MITVPVIVEQTVDIPVLADLQGFPPGQSPTARAWLDGGGFQGFHPGQVSDGPFDSSAELGAHSSSSTLSAHQMPLHEGDAVAIWVDDNDDAWTMVDNAHGLFWLNLNTRHSQRHPPWERQP